MPCSIMRTILIVCTKVSCFVCEPAWQRGTLRVPCTQQPVTRSLGRFAQWHLADDYVEMSQGVTALQAMHSDSPPTCAHQGRRRRRRRLVALRAPVGVSVKVGRSPTGKGRGGPTESAQHGKGGEDQQRAPTLRGVTDRAAPFPVGLGA
jgi:hypothetical protein